MSRPRTVVNQNVTMRRLALIVAWLGSTIAVTAAAWAVVSAVDDQVSDRPLTPLVASTTLLDAESTTTTSLPLDPSPGTSTPTTPTPSTPGTATDGNPTTPPTSTTSSTVPTSTTAPPTSTTTAPAEGGTSTTTTVATTTTIAEEGESSTTTTATTSAGGQWETRTITTAGGTVVVSHRPEEVILDAATATVGYTVRIELAGPPEVRVEFETTDGKIEVRVRYKDGILDVEVSEEGED